jgi:hypothetical protein
MVGGSMGESSFADDLEDPAGPGERYSGILSSNCSSDINMIVEQISNESKD